MSAKIKYTDEPLGEIRVAQDFLPSPSELAFRDEGVEFFTVEASRHHTQYQRMIRRLLDAYVAKQSHARLAAHHGLLVNERSGRFG